MLTVQMADRQAFSSYSSTLLECPDLWSGTIEPDMWESSPGSPLWYPQAAVFNITNEKDAAEGTYTAMFEVVDSAQDPYLGDINRRYAPIQIVVKHKELPKLNGEIIYTALAPPDPSGGPGARNVFLVKLDTMEKDQITSFMGVGAIFDEPRINPKGTHILYQWDPTPMYSVVHVMELGGSEWDATPEGDYDATADFSPDGKTILAASGQGCGNTPDLYSMNYDGSGRTLIATAPGSVFGPRWSPDGKRIVLAVEDNNSTPPVSNLYIYDVDLKTFTEFSPSDGFTTNPSWSPVPILGHYLIAFQSNRNDPTGEATDVFIADSDTGDILQTIDTGFRDDHPTFSPEGLYVAYTVTDISGTSSLDVYDLKNQIATPIIQDGQYLGEPSWCWGW